jgi:hypothetical protein
MFYEARKIALRRIMALEEAALFHIIGAMLMV